jgi:membrane fusion protein, multidrug efflux system
MGSWLPRIIPAFSLHPTNVAAGARALKRVPRRWHKLVFAVCCLVLAGTASSCQRGPVKGDQNELPRVGVSIPVSRDVTDYVDFTGRADAVQSVNIVARVTGFLLHMPFKEGAMVRAGDLLFEIDPAPYLAQLKQAESQVDVATNQRDLAEKTLTRYQALKKESSGAVSDQTIDQYKAQLEVQNAMVTAAQASLKIYQLNEEYTRVRSPIDGQVSKYNLTVGNLVNQDQTLLTTVVSLDPMYVYFDMDERTLLRIRKAINDGKIKPFGGATGGPDQLLAQLLAAQGAFANTAPFVPQVVVAMGTAALDLVYLPVNMGLQGEEGYLHKGAINFANNQVNSATGSISVRGFFPNPQPKNGVRLLSPGMFVRIRLPIGQPYDALLVTDRAIQTDQDQKFVYVMDADGLAQQRTIQVGALQEDGLRVITEGLKKGDRVIVKGLQQVQSGIKVASDEIPMPSFSQSAGVPTQGSSSEKTK